MNMERDFMGLNSKEPLVLVKQEVNTDSFKEIGFGRGSGMQWPFYNKVSAVPHLTSFKVAQEDQPKRVDPVIPSGFMSVSAADKSFNNEREAATRLSLSAYPLKKDTHFGHCSHEAKMFPFTNHFISNSLSNPLLKNQYASTYQNMVSNVMKPQLLQGFPVTASQAVLPTVGPVAETSFSCSKGSAAPGQLTIFYAGTVNVYEAISPEKAQAIMFLAGSGVTISSDMGQLYDQAPAPNSKPQAVDFTQVNQTPPCSRLASPLSVSSRNGAQSGSGSTNTEEFIAARTTGIATAPVKRSEPATVASALGSISATTLIPSAVPQARKASLARFLEKRKERVMNAAPYHLNKNSLELFAASSKE